MTKKLKIFAMLWTVFITAPLNVVYGYKLLHLVHAPCSLWALFWVYTFSSLIYGAIVGLLAE